MNILVLQETDWQTRGPHIQHHILERLSKNPLIKITVIDYDIDKIHWSKSVINKKKIFFHIDRTIKNSNVKIVRTAHIQIPLVRRFSSLMSTFFASTGLSLINTDSTFGTGKNESFLIGNIIIGSV